MSSGGAARPGRRRPRRLSVALALLALLVALGACGDDEGADPEVGSDVGGRTPTSEETTTTDGDGPSTTGAGETTTSAPSEPGATDTEPPPLADLDVRLEPLLDADKPVKALVRPGTGVLYVAEQGGRLLAVDLDDPADPVVAVDLTGEVATGNEQGLLGLAFSPDGETAYVHHSASDGATTIVSYGLDGDVLDPATRREILVVDQPYPNHNGGELLVDGDGLLWIGLGDGGDADDPERRAQDTDDLLGKILRIDPTAPADGRAYGIPDDNPFATGGGRPEIAVIGVRNPWRMRFDEATGDLWVADVGQNAIEEIDRLPAGEILGANLGWSRFEGSDEYQPDVDLGPGDPVLPVYEVLHSDGWCSISGAAVYRGEAIPGLDGAFVFGDFCRPGLYAVRADGGTVTDEAVLDDTAASVVSVDADGEGEILVLSLQGTVARLVPA